MLIDSYGSFVFSRSRMPIEGKSVLILLVLGSRLKEDMTYRTLAQGSRTQSKVESSRLVTRSRGLQVLM
jgi:hypothetical protein